MEYDAAGHQLKRQTPQMAASAEWIASTYDMVGRLADVSVSTSRLLKNSSAQDPILSA